MIKIAIKSETVTPFGGIFSIYTYRCILTNDYESTPRQVVEFYNLRGGKERIFDEMNNGCERQKEDISNGMPAL